MWPLVEMELPIYNLLCLEKQTVLFWGKNQEPKII